MVSGLINCCIVSNCSEASSYITLAFDPILLSQDLLHLTPKSLSDVAPVDHLPDGAEVLGLAVLVLEVVGVLPGVNTHEGLEVSGDGVLVGTSGDAQGTGGLVLDEPSPAGALDASQSSVGLLLEALEGAEVLIDGSLHMLVTVSFHTIHNIPEACPRAHHRHPCRWGQGSPRTGSG